VGFQNSVAAADLPFRLALVLVDQASKDRLASDPLLGKVRNGMIGAWREKPKRSMWPPTVVVGAVAGVWGSRTRSTVADQRRLAVFDGWA
jgi:hypothetical protein